MLHKILISAILVAAVIVGGCSPNNQNNSSSPIILFYSDTCPHCAKVDEFIKENKTEEKVSFEKKEVYRNQANARELADKAKACRLPTDQIGVPFLWDGSKCFVGDVDVIDFFKQKTEIQ